MLSAVTLIIKRSKIAAENQVNVKPILLIVKSMMKICFGVSLDSVESWETYAFCKQKFRSEDPELETDLE